MKIFLKLLVIFILIAVFFIVGFELWGSFFDILFSQAECGRWFVRIKPWAWAAGIGLLLTDLVLPIPATGIMAALGSVYGVWMGALIAAAGSTAAGLAGYALARLIGRRVTRLLASDEELHRFKAVFDSWGGAAIIVSRCLPVLPEVLSILAGLARMSLSRFVPALLLGTLPTSFLFAYMGDVSSEMPAYGMAFAVLAPLLFWPFFLRLAARYRTEA